MSHVISLFEIYTNLLLAVVSPYPSPPRLYAQKKMILNLFNLKGKHNERETVTLYAVLRVRHSVAMYDWTETIRAVFWQPVFFCPKKRP